MRKLLASVPVVGVTVLAMAVPAFAAVAGSGTHSGSTSQNNYFKSTGCFETIGSYSGTGSTSVAISDGTYSYSGNVTVSWSYDFYQTADGSVTDCTSKTAGAGAASGGTMKSSPTGHLLCSWPSGGTYDRVGTGTSALTIDFPASSGGCSVQGHTQVAMHFNNPGGFNQVGGVADCTGASTSHPPSGCRESFSFNLS